MSGFWLKVFEWTMGVTLILVVLVGPTNATMFWELIFNSIVRAIT